MNYFIKKVKNIFLGDKNTEKNTNNDVIYAPSITVSFPQPQITINDGRFLKNNSFNSSQKYWIKAIYLPYKRNIFNIPQYRFEITKLYADLSIMIDNWLKERNYSLKKLHRHVENTDEQYNNILYTIFCIAEGVIDKAYRGNKGYNSDFSRQLLTRYIGQDLMNALDIYIDHRKQSIPLPTDETLSIIYKMNPGIWKQNIQDIINKLDDSNCLSLCKKIENILNKVPAESWPKNINIYWKLTKAFSLYDRPIALFYYYKYCYKNLKIKKMTKKMHQSLFKNTQQYEAFLEILKQPLNNTELTAKVMEIAPRYKIVNINMQNTDKIRQTNNQTVSKLNQFFNKEKSAVTSIVIQDNVKKNPSRSLDDIFSSTKSVNQQLKFNPLQEKLLHKFRQLNYRLPLRQINEFARQHNTFPQLCINEINNLFQTHHQDHIIQQEEEICYIKKEYIPLIDKAVKYV